VNIGELLKGRSCSCGMEHTCEIAHVVIDSGALQEVESLTKGYAHILLVADNNTWKICGEEVKAQLGNRLEDAQVFVCDGFLVPDEKAIAKVQKKLTEHTDLIIGIGSGVIQDLCKYVSFEAKLPYYIVATAPSMDGYASKGAAMIIGNMKVTYNAHVPKAIIADTRILKGAPMEMIQSGYGDILGKFSCLNDWKLSCVVNDEFFCDYVYDLTYEMLMKTKDLGKKLLAREEEAVKTLMEALVGVGIAMAYIGNSRPASGSEHHLSHFFEVIGLMKNEPYFMHGTDVVYSAVYTQKLREELLALDAPVQGAPFDKGRWEATIRDTYLDAAEGVIALQNKLDFYSKNRQSIYQGKWQEIQTVLQEAPSAETLTGYLQSVGLSLPEFEKLYGDKKIQDAIFFAKDLKDRYTVLWLYYHCFYK